MKIPNGIRVAGAVITNGSQQILARYEIPILWSSIFVIAAAIGSPMWLLAIVGVYAGWNWLTTAIEQYKEVREMASSMSLMSGLFNKPPPATKEVELTVTETTTPPDPKTAEQNPPKPEKPTKPDKVTVNAGTNP